jgi:hypothetical protein
MVDEDEILRFAQNDRQDTPGVARTQPCPAEPMRCTQGQLREASGCPSSQRPFASLRVTKFGDSAGTLLAFSSHTNNNPANHAAQGR